jgi:hypothetical protein
VSPRGAVLTGVEGKLVIQEMRGFPPVAGLDPNAASYQIAVQDPRDGDKKPFATQVGAGWQVLWIPPAGWSEGREPYVMTDFATVEGSARETNGLQPMPEGLSTVQVIAKAAYVARVSIYDNLGNLVNTSEQAFGGRGELKNMSRAAAKGMAGWLVWDQRDAHGRKAGQGVYVWKVAFRFATGKSEVRYVRTGLLR